MDNILAVRPPQHYPEPGVHKKQNKAHTFKALVAAMPANAKKTKSTQVGDTALVRGPPSSLAWQELTPVWRAENAHACRGIRPLGLAGL